MNKFGKFVAIVLLLVGLGLFAFTSVSGDAQQFSTETVQGFADEALAGTTSTMGNPPARIAAVGTSSTVGNPPRPPKNPRRDRNA